MNIINAIPVIGRILFGGFFLFSGLGHFTQLKSMAAYAAVHGVPYPEAAVALTGVLLLIGGASVLFGVAPRAGLALLVAFLVPVTAIMHPFWTVTDAQQRMVEMVSFMKNVALIGASLVLMALPQPWAYSVDQLISRRWPRWEDGSRLTPQH